MDGRRYLLKAQLEKERLELERKREEEEARRKKELAGVHESRSMDVPSPQGKPPAVTVEVPADIMQVGLPSNREGSVECSMDCVMEREMSVLSVCRSAANLLIQPTTTCRPYRRDKCRSICHRRVLTLPLIALPHNLTQDLATPTWLATWLLSVSAKTLCSAGCRVHRHSNGAPSERTMEDNSTLEVPRATRGCSLLALPLECLLAGRRTWL